MGIMNAMGGLLAEIGSRQLTLTAATFWFGLNKIDISSKNTSVSDVFNLVWSAGNTPNQTTVPNA